MCVKICVILFTMLKSVYKIDYQMAPKFICNDLLSIQCFGKPFVLLGLFPFITEYNFDEITFYALSNNKKCKKRKKIQP